MPRRKLKVKLSPLKSSFEKNLDRVADGKEPVYDDTPMKKLPLHEPPPISKKTFDRKRSLGF